MCMAIIVVEIHSLEYNVYSRTIRRKAGTPNPMGARGQAVFRTFY